MGQSGHLLAPKLVLGVLYACGVHPEPPGSLVGRDDWIARFLSKERGQRFQLLVVSSEMHSERPQMPLFRSFAAGRLRLMLNQMELDDVLAFFYSRWTMRRRLLFTVLAACLLASPHAVAQNESQQISPTPTATPTPSSAGALAQVIDTHIIEQRLTGLETKLDGLLDAAEETDWTPWIAVAGSLLGILIGSGIGYCTTMNSTSRALHHQESLANARARLEISSAIVQWRLKQVCELYGPLHALLQQSNEIYRHMNRALETANPERFRLRKADEPDGDLDDQQFDIKIDGNWTGFRTVVHMNEVYGRDYGIEPYFDALVEVGGQMRSVIQRAAGYARPDQPELPPVLGQYLAHYSVLNRLHRSWQGSGGKHRDVQYEAEMRVGALAAFPKQIQRVVSKGLALLNADIALWSPEKPL